MTTMNIEQFEKLVQEQKDSLNAIKWRELQKGQIYKIESVEFINTQYGEACILSLDDMTKVYAPSALAKRLKQDKDKPFPRYVRPVGRVQSKKNLAHTYYAFDLV